MLHTDQAFAVFLAGFAESVDELVLVGRLDPIPATWHYRIPAEVRFVALPYYAALSGSLAGLLALARSVARFWGVLPSVDVIWLLGPHPLALVFAALGWVRRKHVVLGVRQDFPRYVRSRHPDRRLRLLPAHALEQLFRLLARRLPVIVVGEALARHYAGARRRLTVLISLVRAADLQAGTAAPQRSYEGELQVLSVGRLEEEKNPLLLADVLASLLRRDRRWRLVVCGDGPLREPLRRRLEALGVADRAELRGYVPIDGGLWDLYRSSHALLHVAWTEGFPQVLVEAFASGLPVVGTSVGGVADVAEGCALLIPPGDPDAAATELARLATSADLRARLVELGLERARRHTLEAERERILQFMEGTRHLRPASAPS